MSNKEIVVDQLRVMGFEPFKLGELGYVFSYEDMKYLYMPDDEDEQFLRIVIPYLFDVTDENRVAVLEAMQETGLMLKCSKVCIMHESSVWAIYEHCLNSTDNLQELLEHIIQVLETTVHVFYKRINGEDVIGRSEDVEDSPDDELEATLQRILDGIKDEKESN